MKTQIIAIFFWLLMACCPVDAAPDKSHAAPETPQIITAFNFMESADEAMEKAQNENALKLYAQALDAYSRITQDYPQWKQGLIKFRTTYCSGQIQRLLSITKGLSPKPKTAVPAEGGQIKKIVTIATKYLKNNKHAKARSILMEGLDINPDNTAIRLLLGIAQSQASEFDDALQILQALVKESPSNAHAHIALAAAHMGIGQTRKAKDEISAALKLNPNMPEAHYNMVRILVSIMPLDKKTACYHYEKAIDLGAKPTKALDSLLKQE
ncbi:MAG: tetratricopeptide repeat protein [Kiritimatiellae bacterium]|nr:tetratricopeptide repeat protein [Kiritimatiellia bacterium]